MIIRECKQCGHPYPLTADYFRPTSVCHTYFRHTCNECHYAKERAKRALQNANKPERERVPRLKKTGPKPATLPHEPYFAHVAELPGWLSI